MSYINIWATSPLTIEAESRFQESLRAEASTKAEKAAKRKSKPKGKPRVISNAYHQARALLESQPTRAFLITELAELSGIPAKEIQPIVNRMRMSGSVTASGTRPLGAPVDSYHRRYQMSGKGFPSAAKA